MYGTYTPLILQVLVAYIRPHFLQDLVGGPAYVAALNIIEQEVGPVHREHFDHLAWSKGRGKGDGVPHAGAAAPEAMAAGQPASGAAMPQPGKGAGKGNVP